MYSAFGLPAPKQDGIRIRMISTTLRFSRFDDLYEPQAEAASRLFSDAEPKPDLSDNRTNPTPDDDRTDRDVRLRTHSQKSTVAASACRIG